MEIDNLYVTAGKFHLDKVCLDVPQGQCGSLMGMSGSGKTSLMEAICGLRRVVSGSIKIGGQDVTYLAPADRGIGLVPQENVLFPSMTVAEQIAYGPKVKKWANVDIQQRVNEVAAELKISHLLERLPKYLSGGEAKRVAIARAIAPKPNLLCLDESFTGLDDQTHGEVMQVVKEAIAVEKMTTLFITHHLSEAQFLADVHFTIKMGKVSRAE